MFKQATVIIIFLIMLSCHALGVEAAAYYDFSLTSPINSSDLFYSDENIAISFPITSSEIKRIPFVLYNRTSEPIKLDWNQVSFISTDNSSLKTYHAGILLTDAHGNKPMNPSIIPPNTKLSDFIGISNGITFIGSHAGWEEQCIFPSWFKDAAPHKNDSFSIFMPLEMNGKIKYYTFTFLIKNITKEWESQPYLGIGGLDKDKSVIYGINIKNDKGVYIAHIFPNSAAEKAGLRVGDVMVKFNDLKIDSFSDFINAINDCKAGSKVGITVLRNDQSLDILATLGERAKP